jgi:hypothetical protein
MLASGKRNHNWALVLATWLSFISLSGVRGTFIRRLFTICKAIALLDFPSRGF